MEQARRPSGLTPAASENVFLSAGASFFDVDLTGISNGMSAADFLKIMDGWQKDGKGFGATTGDPVLTIPRELTRIVTNDLHVDVIGLFDSRGGDSATLSFTVQELASPELWKRVVGTTFEDPEDGSMRIGTVVRQDHYKNIAYINMANNGDIFMYYLMNAIQTNNIDATFSNTIGTPASIPVVFTATLASLEDINLGAHPVKIFTFPFETTAGGLTATFAAQAEAKGSKNKGMVPNE